ncbi:phosphonate C-P lyase system protein PhnH [Geminicoccus roseus]|uniref:phosphonate C-P lyase system protein PhnH n=1 Tax=Geminicoccus roseus TaxID=404900 RepID=UPI00040B191A|nr:phosphonate C-P lyase system protein PhnH [Geminicoccus roseus]
MTSLAGGLADPVHDAQRQFRDLLHAMSHPGTVVPLRGMLPPAPAPLATATYALLLGLADHETRLWIDGEHRDARASLRFHTGAGWVQDPADASFAVVAEGGDLPPLDQFGQGDPDYPDRSSTVFLQVARFGHGQTLHLAGPGIDGRACLQVDGVPADFGAMLRANRSRFPQGVDLVLVAGATIACLPRSIQVEG